MKKVFTSMVVFFVVVCFGFFVYAESDTIVKLIVGNSNATVNGKQVKLDVPPKVEKGRTLVPLRFIAEALGAKVDFEPKTQTITLTLKNIEELQSKINELTKQMDTAKAEYAQQVADLQKQIDVQVQTISDKEKRIGELEQTVVNKEKEITDLQNKIVDLQKQVDQLQEDLKNAGGSKRETNPPVIKVTNIVDGQAILELTKIQATIEDESGIVFVRVKLGSLLLSEDPKNLGEIKPEKFVSGDYKLTIEAYDSYANKAILEKPIKIQNNPKTEPIVVKVIPVDQPGGGMMGGKPEDTIAMLNVQIVNKGDSNIEIMKIECYDKQGTLDELQPGMNFFDMIKSMQLGMEHLWIHAKDKFGPLPVSLDFQGSKKKAAEFYEGWKVKITIFDSVMNEAFIQEIAVK